MIAKLMLLALLLTGVSRFHFFMVREIFDICVGSRYSNTKLNTGFCSWFFPFLKDQRRRIWDFIFKFHSISLAVDTTISMLQVFESASQYTDFLFSWLECTKELFLMYKSSQSLDILGNPSRRRAQETDILRKGSCLVEVFWAN